MAKDLAQAQASGRKVSLREKIGFACSPATLEMISNFNSLYLMVFFTNVCGISPAAAGTLMLLCTLWNAINDPLIGFFADNRLFKNGEKMRPYYKLCTVPMGIFLILIYWMPQLDPKLGFVYAFVMYFFCDTFATAVQMPALSMPMLMTDDADQRISINTWYALGSTIGPILCSVIAVTLMRFFGGVLGDGTILNARAGYRGAIIVFVAVMIAGQFIAYAAARERVKPIRAEKTKVPLGRLLAVLFGERNWVLNLLFALCYVLVMQMVMGTVVYYATSVLDLPGYEQVIAPVLLIASFMPMPFIGLINKRFSRRGILVLAGACFLLSKIPFIFFPRALWTVFFNAAVMGMGISFGLVGINSNQAEVVDIIEWKSGYRIEGSINAIRGFVFKGLGAMAPFLLGLFMQLSGYVAPTEALPAPVQNAATQQVFISFLGWAPMIIAALMVLLAFAIPTDRDAAEMRRLKAEKQSVDERNGGMPV